MVYLAELLAVTTDRLIARIRCRNVPLIHGHKRLDDDASLASVTPGKRRCRVLGAPGSRPVKTQKSSPDNLPMSDNGL